MFKFNGLAFSGVVKALMTTSIVCVSAMHAVAQTYSITDLGTLGGPGSRAMAINNNGDIVGGADTTLTQFFPFGSIPVEHAVLWQNSGGIIDLGTNARTGLPSS
ncbi:MAG: hypothetical protein OHK0029_18380 [Armatimonadaceae bacterium]